jgi:hypothetical protein
MFDWPGSEHVNIVDNPAILAIVVPFGWGMGRKYDQILGKVLFELGSNRSRARMQDLQKLNWRHGKDGFWKQICHVYFVFCKRPFHGKTPLGPSPVSSYFVLVPFWSVTSTPFKQRLDTEPGTCVDITEQYTRASGSCGHHTGIYVYCYVFMYEYIHICMYIYMYLYIYIYIHTYIYIYMYVYVCVHIYIYI